MPPVPEERLERVRVYLRQAFPDWELADRWDGDHECHAFRLTKHREPVHLLRVSRTVLDDNQPEELSVLLAARGVINALREVEHHRLLLTTHGLVSI